MQSALTKRVEELVECGWYPETTTETTASLVGRRPFSWWLFLLVIVFFPLFGGIVYLIFWFLTSRATIFLHQEGDRVVEAGDVWLVRGQEARRDAFIAEQRAVKENGFLTVMWPKLVSFLVLMIVWVVFLRWYF
jgi:hypothetical protein